MIWFEVWIGAIENDFVIDFKEVEIFKEKVCIKPFCEEIYLLVKIRTNETVAKVKVTVVGEQSVSVKKNGGKHVFLF